MTTIELKHKIISQIEKSNNIHLLKELHHMLNIEETDPYELNEYQKSVVEEARVDILKGKSKSRRDPDQFEEQFKKRK